MGQKQLVNLSGHDGQLVESQCSASPCVKKQLLRTRLDQGSRSKSLHAEQRGASTEQRHFHDGGVGSRGLLLGMSATRIRERRWQQERTGDQRYRQGKSNVV